MKDKKLNVTFNGDTLTIQGLSNYQEKDDDIAEMIKGDSYIPNKRLWRRWIMSQTLRFADVKEDGKLTFSQNFMLKKPYRYAWDTTLAEIKAIADMPADSTDRKRRMTFYNKYVVLAMLHEYQNKMVSYLKYFTRSFSSKSGKKKFAHKGNSPFVKTPYFATISVNGKETTAPIIHFAETNISVILAYGKYTYTVNECCKNDTIMTADSFINAISNVITKIDKESRYHRIADTLTAFINTFPMSRLGYRQKTNPTGKTPPGTRTHDMAKPAAWKNAFLGAGAYYTMDNMIKFHGCHIQIDGEILSTEKSLEQLDEWADMYSCSKFDNLSRYNYRFGELHKLMREFVTYNNFSIDKIPHSSN